MKAFMFIPVDFVVSAAMMNVHALYSFPHCLWCPDLFSFSFCVVCLGSVHILVPESVTMFSLLPLFPVFLLFCYLLRVSIVGVYE